MYDIRQFLPTLYLVVLLGLTGFCIADHSVGLWGLAALGVGLNAWLVKTKRFSPLPRPIANVVTLMAFGYMIVQLSSATQPPLQYIGQFLFFLQIIKLYERRANRDFAQILILSLLLVVAASISTASLGFGIVLIVYLVLALYCCLLFHLKIEADRAKAAVAIPEERLSPSTLRQDERFLPRSMRRVTGLVSIVSTTSAVLVFVFFPRGSGQGLFGQYQVRQATSLTGFAERVSFDQISRIKQNEEVVANVFLWKNGKPIQGTESLFLRGFTLDTYGMGAARGSYRPQWTRSRQLTRQIEVGPEEEDTGISLNSGGDVWRQRIVLRPTGTRYLFAIPGLMYVGDSPNLVPAFRPNRRAPIRFSRSDDSIQTEAMGTSLEYDVYCTNAPAMGPAGAGRRTLFLSLASSDKSILDQIYAYTIQNEIAGDLVAHRSQLPAIEDANEEIGRRIETYLRNHFTYTLDLTGSRDQFRGMDPVVAFLTRVRKGHCEYFASAMTLMCQSLGVPARMVVGFRCDAEAYNVIAGCYTVRQAHAHTWVEVLTPRGWVTFDPTSGREAPAARASSIWESIKQFGDYLEYKWAQNVVAYDARDRDNILVWLDSATTNALENMSVFVIEFGDMFRRLTEQHSFWAAYLHVLVGMVALLVVAGTVAIVWYLWQQRRLRRRAARIGLEGLPVGQQIRLARQLAFYDQLTRVLQRHHVVRPAHLTPMEFCHSLVFLPTQVYDTICRLTDILYRVRFGDAELTAVRQRRLQTVVGRLAASLERAAAHVGQHIQAGNGPRGA